MKLAQKPISRSFNWFGVPDCAIQRQSHFWSLFLAQKEHFSQTGKIKASGADFLCKMHRSTLWVWICQFRTWLPGLFHSKKELSATWPISVPRGRFFVQNERRDALSPNLILSRPVSALPASILLTAVVFAFFRRVLFFVASVIRRRFPPRWI